MLSFHKVLYTEKICYNYRLMVSFYPFPHPVLGVPIISDPVAPVESITVILGQPDTPTQLQLNCSVEAHPIPVLSWNRDSNISLDGDQGITGFRSECICAYMYMYVHVYTVQGLYIPSFFWHCALDFFMYILYMYT